MPGADMTEDQKVEWLWKKRVRASLILLQGLAIAMAILMLTSIWVFLDRRNDEHRFQNSVAGFLNDQAEADKKRDKADLTAAKARAIDAAFSDNSFKLLNIRLDILEKKIQACQPP